MPLSTEVQRDRWRARARRAVDRTSSGQARNISVRRSRSRALDRLSSGRTDHARSQPFHRHPPDSGSRAGARLRRGIGSGHRSPAAAGNRGPGFVDPRTNVTLYRSLSAHWRQMGVQHARHPGWSLREGPSRLHGQPRGQPTAAPRPFLAGPFALTGTVHRTCTRTVERGTRIFLPVINTECSDREDRPFFGATPGQRRACAQNSLFDARGLSASVDRQPIPVSQAKFSIVSRDSRFTSVSGNPAIGRAVPGHSTSRGVWLLLEALPIGEHTIRFAGSYPNADFSLSVTYCLTVA